MISLHRRHTLDIDSGAKFVNGCVAGIAAFVPAAASIYQLPTTLWGVGYPFATVAALAVGRSVQKHTIKFTEGVALGLFVAAALSTCSCQLNKVITDEESRKSCTVTTAQAKCPASPQQNYTDPTARL